MGRKTLFLSRKNAILGSNALPERFRFASGMLPLLFFSAWAESLRTLRALTRLPFAEFVQIQLWRGVNRVEITGSNCQRAICPGTANAVLVDVLYLVYIRCQEVRQELFGEIARLIGYNAWMPQLTLKRLLASVTLVAVGCGILGTKGLIAHGALPFGWDWDAICVFSAFGTIGAGIGNIFKKPVIGAILGLCSVPFLAALILFVFDINP